ncbi:MAG: dihydroorotase [Candidatus Bipolaricaulota bacterium]|nr:dihydroorotase [Candidatus Bipolaricaulota bacterium]MDW8152470.1 dihydroorotase [Candidatus Bipolaricaulota bacterium]
MTVLLIRGVRVVDALGEWRGDVAIREGRFVALGQGFSWPGALVLEGEGRTLLPAFVDLHAHFRDPGFPEKEDLRTGSWAAAHGGFTAVALMANTDPPCDTPEVARYVVEKARALDLVEVYPVGAITVGLRGERLVDFQALAPYVWAFSDDGKGVERADLMAQALRRAAALGKLILSHPEFAGLERPLAEELMVARDLRLAQAAGAALHLQHLSSPGSVELVRRAKAEGVRVTAEVTPHHLCLSQEAFGDYPVNPPLPGEAARQGLVAALRAGVLDAVATDHAPHTPEAKAQGAPGISGIETAFPLLYTRLVREGLLPLAELSRYLSLGPARILGLRKGLVRPGYDADCVLVEEDESFVVDEAFFLSKSTNTPVLGLRLWGRVWATLRRGEVIHLAGRVRGRDYHDHRQVVGAG